MDNYRSKSCRDMQVENYKYGTETDLAVAPGMNHLTRSYTTNHAASSSSSSSYASSSVHPPAPAPAPAPPPPGYYNNSYMMGKEIQIKKVNNTKQGGSMAKAWSFNDPELKRKKRVAAYKVYTVESQMKGSFRKSFRWIKDIVSGWR